MKPTLSITTAALFGLAAAIVPLQADGQSFGDDWKKEFNATAKAHAQDFEDTARSHFEKIRSNLNEQFAKTIEGVWASYNVLEGIPAPVRPGPERPVVAPEVTPQKPAPAPVELIPGKLSVPAAPIKPIDLAVPENPRPRLAEEPRVMQFDFYGTVCQIRPCDLSWLHAGTEPGSVASGWKKVSSDKQTQQLVDDCVRLRESMSLPDIGYMWLLEAVAAEVCPGDKSSQAFLVTYLLNQSGYDARVGTTRSGLTVLFHPDMLIYANKRVEIDGKDYYIRDKELADQNVFTYKENFYKDGIPLRMAPDRLPLLGEKGPEHEYSSSRWLTEPEFKVTVNEPTVKFLGDYPQISWEHYARAPLSREFKENVVETIRQRTKGENLNALDGVRKILSFIQYGFDYKTDQNQYGYEKVNFPDENFYYPFNDCEDRSILFAALVHEIYGLDVVLLHYPAHLAAAVDFGDPTVKGDYFNLGGKHYVVCDPTFIGAPVGMCMPQYRGVQPEIFTLK